MPRTDTTPTLAERLQPLIRGELAAIGAINAVVDREDDPAYVALYHEARTGKQANVEQMFALLRRAGEQPVEAGGLMESALRMQSSMLQAISTTAVLLAMRTVQEELVAGYRETYNALQGFEQRAMRVPFDRATKQWMLLIAHVAQRRDGNSAHADLLPLPLSSYFATPEARVCMRCMLDRPGEHSALEKRDPHPYTYVCAACHDETLADFPPDLREQADRWPERLRHDRVIERAIGRPSRLRAEKEVLAALAGLEPEVPPPAEPTPVAEIARGPRPPESDRPSDLWVPAEGGAPAEVEYTDLLFDYRSVRRNW
jgi:hypothetical protein